MPDNRPFIIAAYAVTWIALLGYAVRLYRARAEAERRLQHAAEDLTGGQS